MMKNGSEINSGKTSLGIELGSTRIKAVLIGEDFSPIASGESVWENRFENGVWTYRLSDVWAGIEESFGNLKKDVMEKYGVVLRRPGAIGVSAMMHGYLPFDKDANQLAEFRTWRNTITGEEAEELTELFGFNVPQRFSIAHLWHAVKTREEHTGRIDFLTTLEGYVHFRLTGEKVIGVGEAAGMFPLSPETLSYDGEMVKKFDRLKEPYNLPWKLLDILPRILYAGQHAGNLTEEGARLLDPEGDLEAGIPFCPPEGDAGTGMTATNSVSPRSGNVSAGTSVFLMAVLEKGLSKVHPEIDMVATPAGKPVAMVHVNTCSSDIDAWVGLFGELLKKAGKELSKNELYTLLYREALSGEPDCGGLLSYNYYGGEPVINLPSGSPMFIRGAESRHTLPNFMRSLLYSSIATLAIGKEILDSEGVEIDKLYGHGGFFKTPVVGQRFLAGALGVPVAVMETAGEGGPWGMALLAAYMKDREDGESLEDFLKNKVFSNSHEVTLSPDKNDMKGFKTYIGRYRRGLALEIKLSDLML